jgi:xylulokinase
MVKIMYLMGVDVGSTVCKVVIYDPEGHIISSTSEEYRNLFITPREGWCEYDTEVLWRTVADCIKRSIIVGKINSTDVAAVSVSVSGESVAPIGKDGKAVYNGIFWTDKRANYYKQQLEILKERIGPLKIYQITGYPLNYIPSSVKILWIKAEMPEVYERTWKFMLWEDFINWKLTGEDIMSYSTASSSQLFDIRAKRWSYDILEALDINVDILPECVPSGKIVGEVNSEASKATGLSRETLVVAGGWDQACCAFGAGVVNEGEACDTAGTVECITPAIRDPILDERTLSSGFYCSPHLIDDLYVYFAFFPTAGSILKWFRDTFAEKEIEMAKATGRDAYDILTEEAAEAKPGANGLLLLPFFEGSGAGLPPAFDTNARGVLIGLTLSHRKNDIVRAIMEGIAFQTRVIIEKIEEFGIKISELRAVGGGAKSKLWMQIKADITRKKIILPDVTEAGTLGVAMLASVASKLHPNYKRAVEKMCKEKAVFYPREDITEIYERYYEVYKELYPTLIPIFAKMAEKLPHL